MKAAEIVCGVLMGVLIAMAVGTMPGRSQPPEAKTQAANVEPWWRNAVFYEVYVRSFQDTNGDGVGDIRGVISRLDYLQHLGVDAIWLTPVYPSPQYDLGYDVSDYCAVDPLFGTMADLEELIAKAKKLHIRVLMDLVLNHTSDQHSWFQASRNPKDPKRDWYIWDRGWSGTPPKLPNNWLDRTNDSAWEYDSKSGDFYYHYFAKQQPDLNWRNPDVQKAMYDVVDFWLRKGVAGFRLDAVNMLFEDPQLRDEPKLGTNEYGEPSQSQQYQRNLPEVHDVMKGLRKDVERFPDSPVLIGEIYTSNLQEAESWYGRNQDELQLPMYTSLGFLNKRDASLFRHRLNDVGTLPDGDTPLLVFDNHDQRRSIDRYGDGQHNEVIAKVIATILLGSRGSALIYQGQEIGMTTSSPKRFEDLRDPRAIAGWPKERGRDGERTPMQWTPGKNAGFTSGTPWLGLPQSFAAATVETEASQPDSLLNWYETLMVLRRKSNAMHYGTQTMLNADEANVLAWVRTAEPGAPAQGDLLVICNLSAQNVSVDLGKELRKLHKESTSFHIQLNSLEAHPPSNATSTNHLILAPFQVLVGAVDSAP